MVALFSGGFGAITGCVLGIWNLPGHHPNFRVKRLMIAINALTALVLLWVTVQTVLLIDSYGQSPILKSILVAAVSAVISACAIYFLMQRVARRWSVK